MLPDAELARIGAIGNCAALLQNCNDACLANALPWQAECERIQLGLGNLRCRCTGARPDEAALVQSPGGQPHANAVVHQDLQATGAPIGKAIGVMRARRTEHLHHLGQDRLAARAHVQRIHGQPDRLNADHFSNSRIQPAHSAAAATGHITATLVVPRRSSMRMSAAGADTGGGKDTGTKAGVTATAGSPLPPARRRHLCTTLALMPWASATL